MKSENEIVNYINNDLMMRTNRRTDLETIKKAITAVYEFEKAAPPKEFYLFESPKQMGEKLCEVKGEDKKNWKDVLNKEDVFPMMGCVPSFFYVRFKDESSKECMNKYIEVLESAHKVVFFKEEVFVCEYPTTIKYEGLQLHSDVGPSVEYKDGYKMYHLWGIEVPAWAAKPVDELDVDQVMGVTNADQRAVIQRKYGFDRLRKELNAEVVDTNDEYELITFEIQGQDDDEKRRSGPYLVMKGYTTGQTHCEGVGSPGLDQNIKTVEQAHLFRDPRLKPGFKVAWGK